MIDAKKIEELKIRLVENKDRIEKELGNLANKEKNGDYSAKFEDFGRDEEDNAEEVESYAANIGIIETLEKNLNDIKDALKKIESGAYGKCENCSTPIKAERLEAYPSARICMQCSKQN